MRLKALGSDGFGRHGDRRRHDSQFHLGLGGDGPPADRQEAMRALPDYVPDFMKTDDAITAIGEYSREPDRWRKFRRCA